MRLRPREHRQVWVIEWLNKRGLWETWEIHGQGHGRCEGGGLRFYRKRLRRARNYWKGDRFRLVRYVPDAPPKFNGS